LMVTGQDGTIKSINATFCRWLGYEAAQLVDLVRFPEILPMGARLFHQTHWAPLLQMQGSISEVQLDLLHSNGTRVPMMLNVRRKAEAEGQFDEIAAFVATERKLYERELLHARRLAEATTQSLRETEARLIAANQALSHEHRRKDEFLATLAHELRNPLAPMTNAIHILSRPDLSTDRLAWANGMLDRQLRQMTHLIEDLLDTSRISLGKIELRLQPVEIGALLVAVAEAARATFDQARQQFVISVGASPLTVLGDSVRLTQIVANLLTNASKYTPDGGRIELALRTEGGDALIDVSDTGIGIEPEQMGGIFDMFSQLTSGGERAAGGLGIGLSLTKGLVELHGGTVTGHSAGAGQGSRFSVRLPLANDLVLTESAEALVPTPDAGGDRVLIVDDNVDAADSLSMALELVGYRTCTAYTATQALACIDAFMPTVALLDIGLPDFDGHELARRIRRLPHARHLYLIAATGWGQESDRQAAHAAGFDLHMTKPVEFDLLHQAIAERPQP
jgi:PAS domain S-box-containing protein